MEKYKIVATKSQLEKIGISYDIKNSEGTLIKKFDTGWYYLEVIRVVGDMIFKNKVDIPETFLEKIK
ncbi:MAG: hypothetical protein ACOC3Z_03515 [Nanoarchaeota archaeon]